jgi:cytochrome P450
LLSDLQGAGRDTTANALTWMFYLLHKDGADKNDVKKIYQEVDDLLQGSNPDYDTLKKMKFIEAWYVYVYFNHFENCKSM